MRANRVKKGVRVKIISGIDTGQYGTIEGILDGIIAVRADNAHFARHYTSNQLTLIKKIA